MSQLNVEQFLALPEKDQAGYRCGLRSGYQYLVRIMKSEAEFCARCGTVPPSTIGDGKPENGYCPPCYRLLNLDSVFNK